MKKFAFVQRSFSVVGLLLSFCSAQFLFGQNAPGIDWEKCLGGSNSDDAYSVVQTTDGKFIVVGVTGSTDGDVDIDGGYSGYWVVKLDSLGNIDWQESLGGSNTEYCYAVERTANGGCIIAGASASNDGDVSGNHGNFDYWIVRLDSSGNILWQKCFGGSTTDVAYSISQTTDGGFIIAGYTESDDGDVTGHHDYGKDFWMVKIDSVGNKIWQRCLGGSGSDEAHSIKQTMDGGFIVAGATSSNDGTVSGNHPCIGGYQHDYWVVKLSSIGKVQWQKCLGGSGTEMGYSIIQTPDEGFIVGGSSQSDDGDVTGHHAQPGDADYWIVKLDNSGNILWQKSLGGEFWDEANSICLTKEGKTVIAGGMSSEDIVCHHGNYAWSDYWIVKLDDSGNSEWQKCLGGTEFDHAYSIQQTIDNGFIVAGYAASYDGDVTGHHGYPDITDYWVVKLSADPTGITTPKSISFFSISPNPTTGNFQLTFPTPLHQPTTLSITNLLGQKLFEEEIPENTSQQAFDFSQWQRGMYFITIRDEHSFDQKQLVIQ